MIQHNTPGKDDGEQAFWIDGQLRGHWRGFNWRTTPPLFANAFTLESYITDRWTKQTTNIIYFDNVVILDLDIDLDAFNFWIFGDKFFKDGSNEFARSVLRW